MLTRFTALSLLLSLFAACGTPAHRVDENSNEGITTVRNLDFKDYQLAAEDLIDKLLASGRIPDGPGGEPPVVMVSQIRNSTSSHIDTQLLTQKVTIALDKSEQARTTTAVSHGGDMDPASKNVRNLEDEQMFDPDTLQKGRTLQAPSYSLGGEITELYRQAGRKRESYYQIYLTLTDLESGLAIWQDAKEIVKQDKKPLFGF